jgi:hypothetical protein
MTLVRLFGWRPTRWSRRSRGRHAVGAPQMTALVATVRRTS